MILSAGTGDVLPLGENGPGNHSRLRSMSEAFRRGEPGQLHEEVRGNQYGCSKNKDRRNKESGRRKDCTKENGCPQVNSQKENSDKRIFIRKEDDTSTRAQNPGL